ncbi:MAG TPA: prepilin-type N-terminal cleavage/methylation domain-containing protein [Gemmatimonadaceae bacterium]|nr:prepilin-type N-terminal cleavage/methylation domain-containing protein [Gemmatimonadaceae bacterium]
MRSDRGGAGRARRAGLSIVEVLVALVLITVGLLGVAGASARAIRVSTSAARERRATQRAANRVAVLASQGCSAARGGALADSAAQMSERWTVTPTAAGVSLVDAAVRWNASGGARSVTLRSAILC